MHSVAKKRRPLITLVGAAALAQALAACAVVDESIPCTEDYDCAAGNICAPTLTCALAGASDGRNFGQLTLSSQGPDETHLLVVYDVPTAEAVEIGEVAFTLGGVDGAAIGPAAVVRQVSAPLPRLSAGERQRFSFERRRRARVNRFIDDLHAGRRTTRGAAVRHNEDICATDCGAAAMCSEGTCVGGANDILVRFADDGSLVTCLLAGVVPGDVPLNVLVDRRDIAAKDQALAAAQAFSGTLSRQLSIMGLSGHSGAADRNEDGRLTLVFTSHTTEAIGSDIGSDIVGFFDDSDFRESTTLTPSNEADILWVRPAAGAAAVAQVAGTLAHEYFHLVSYALRVHARDSAALREVAWLDEGTAHLMEDLSGWGPSTISIVDLALDQWDIGGFALAGVSGAQEKVRRGQAYLLLRYLVDQGGSGDAGSRATRVSATRLVSGLLSGQALGFEHSVFRDAPRSMAEQWLTAVYSSGNADLLSGLAVGYLPTATDAITGHTIGIRSHGEFYSSSIAGGGEEFFDGPTSFPLSAAELQSEPLSGFVFRSGAVFYEISGLAAGEVVIRGRSEQATPDLRLFSVRVK